MTKTRSRLVTRMVALVACSVVLAAAVPAHAKNKDRERYSMTAQGRGHLGLAAGQAARLILTINSWSTEEELAEIREIISRDDAREIRKALGKAREVGRLQIPGQSGVDIIYTRKVVEDGKTIILWAADRPMGSMPGITTDPQVRYLVAVSVMELADDGKGTGVIAPAIEPSIAEDGSMDVARSAADPITLTSVTLQK